MATLLSYLLIGVVFLHQQVIAQDGVGTEDSLNNNDDSRIASSDVYHYNIQGLNGIKSRNHSLVHFKRSVRPDLLQCRQFRYEPSSPVPDGNLVNLGHGYTLEECQEACVGSRRLTCTAVITEQSGICFLSGYRLMYDFFSIHFTRKCFHGPDCFISQRGFSGGFHKLERIPGYFTHSVQLSSLYCMARCEHQRTYCIAFDLILGDNSRCAFQSSNQPSSEANISFHVRVC